MQTIATPYADLSEKEIKKKIKYLTKFAETTTVNAYKTNALTGIEALEKELDQRAIQQLHDAATELQVFLRGVMPKNALLSTGKIEQGAVN